MFYLVNIVYFVNVYSESDASNKFQTSWDRGKKKILRTTILIAQL